MGKDFKIQKMALNGHLLNVIVPKKEITLEQAIKNGHKIMKKYR